MIESVRKLLFYKEPQLNLIYGPFEINSNNLFFI